MNPTTSMPGQAQRPAGFSLRRLWPLAVLALAIGTFFALRLDMYLTFEALRENRALLSQFVAGHALLASILYVAIYAAVVAASLPGGAVLTVTGGFLFGAVAGTLHVVVAATLGATLLFLIAKTALGDALRAKAGPFLKRMEAGFQENAFNYLLVLRLIPLFPFFIVNLVPAFLGVGLRTYVLATFIGIVPGSFVYASVGAGLGSVFDRNEAFSPASVLTPEIVVALVGLAALAIFPVLYRKLTARPA
ncbi:MAG TPA: TVP38/TMEM64 family protein [Geminicoccaceae bacterium]|nr:TVP38/TMEM64 family protein [Geminicoccaceae bacterium]